MPRRYQIPFMKIYEGAGMNKLSLAMYSALTTTCLMPLSSYADYVKINDDFSIHYETSGSGKQTILFVPGWTMSSAVFEKQFEHYRNSNEYRVISYDPRSQGLTTHSASGNIRTAREGSEGFHRQARTERRGIGRLVERGLRRPVLYTSIWSFKSKVSDPHRRPSEMQRS